MPPLLGLCGIEAPPERAFHGVDLGPLLRGETGGRWAERVLVTDTQRVARPLKWRQSCVMKNRWRLINRTELYDLGTDPAQIRNLAAEHPRLVAELRAAYENWWEICTRRIDDEIPVPVGIPDREETLLRSHDLRNEQDHAVVWNQKQVRIGECCHGYWEITVEQPGCYEFELRRWPRESGHRVAGGIEGADVVFRADGIAPDADGLYRGGRALHIDTAHLEISGLPPRCVEVGPGDEAAVFRVELEPGPCHLRARFSRAAGFYTSAYYVYVRRLEIRTGAHP